MGWLGGCGGFRGWSGMVGEWVLDFVGFVGVWDCGGEEEAVSVGLGVGSIGEKRG